MKATVATATLLMLLSASASDVIDLGRRPASFKDLQGREYNALLLKADLDGVVYVENGTTGGGRVSYTNLAPVTLESWGVPTNRIELAKQRAEAKTKSDQLYKESMVEQSRLNAEAQAKQQRLQSKQAIKQKQVATRQAADDRAKAIADQREVVRQLQRKSDHAYQYYTEASDDTYSSSSGIGGNSVDSKASRRAAYKAVERELTAAQEKLEDMEAGK